MDHSTRDPLLEILKHETVQSVVHDLRTPMTVIKGYLQLLLSGSVGEMPKEQLQLIQRSVGPLEDLIFMTENLMQAVSLGRETGGLNLAETDLDHLLSDTVDFYHLPFQQRRMKIFRDGNTVGEKLLVDGFWIRRVLHNLIWNAYKFTPDGGHVILKVAHTPSGLDLIVEDTGRGIPADKLALVFQRFEQANPTIDSHKGSGLGLWICRRVMELHGGAIRAESREGQGTRFVLSFPSDKIL